MCEGCGDCGEKSSCLSVVPIETEFGRKTAVHQGSCNDDRSCLNGDCPSFVLVTPDRSDRGRRGRRRRPAAPRQVAEPPVDLGVRPSRRTPDDLLVRLPGIGGTGGVTVSRILQMAAHLDGLYAAGLDQTGLAQKGGPVTSDVRIASRPIDAAVKATARSVDLLLGLDVLGTSSDENLATADARRTVAVVTGPAWPRRPWSGTRRFPTSATQRASTGPPGAPRTCTSMPSGSPNGCSASICPPT